MLARSSGLVAHTVRGGVGGGGGGVGGGGARVYECTGARVRGRRCRTQSAVAGGVWWRAGGQRGQCGGGGGVYVPVEAAAWWLALREGAERGQFGAGGVNSGRVGRAVYPPLRGIRGQPMTPGRAVALVAHGSSQPSAAPAGRSPRGGRGAVWGSV